MSGEARRRGTREQRKEQAIRRNIEAQMHKANRPIEQSYRRPSNAIMAALILSTHLGSTQ